MKDGDRLRIADCRLRIGCWLLSVASSIAAAQPDLLVESRTALAESLPSIAISKLRVMLADRALRADERAEATRLLAEAQLAANNAEAARATLQPLLPKDPRAALLHAHALAKSGAWEDALAAYRGLTAKPDAPLAARVGEAEAAQSLGQTEQAIEILKPIVESGDATPALRLRLASLHLELQQLSKARQLLASTKPATPADRLWARYIEGRALLLENQAKAAQTAFAEVLNAPSHLTDELFVAATIGHAETKISLDSYEAADKELETFIWRNPDSAWLELVFRRLDQVYSAEKNPPERELQKWAIQFPPRRAALAQFYLAKMQLREKKWPRALHSTDAFIRLYPRHRLLPWVHLMRADALIALDRLPEAVAALDAASRSATDAALRAQIELRTGLVQLRQREFVLAATSLDRAAEHGGKILEIATYDAALAWLHLNNHAKFEEEYQRLFSVGADPSLLGNLLLEEAFVRARQRDPAALETLRRFRTEFPHHARIGEANLAYAELALAAGNPSETERFLRVANTAPKSPELDDQSAMLAIFLADAKTPRDDAAVIDLAKAFLRGRGQSALVPEVRLKLGQIYFQQPDYPNAETQFATLAKDFPDSPHAETALFLAGQAAARTINTGSAERALRYLDELADRNGPLKLHAREQQAAIQSRLGREQEAVALYDLIIEAKQPAPDATLRATAMVGKGDALASLGRSDPRHLETAAKVFEDLARLEANPPAWRHQALYKRARILEQLGRKADAIAVYNEVLDRNLAASDREFFWFYKAGFEAARAYEQDRAWSSAIAIYEKIARLDGPRAEEAKSRAKQLRVENFVWE